MTMEDWRRGATVFVGSVRFGPFSVPASSSFHSFFPVIKLPSQSLSCSSVSKLLYEVPPPFRRAIHLSFCPRILNHIPLALRSYLYDAWRSELLQICKTPWLMQPSRSVRDSQSQRQPSCTASILPWLQVRLLQSKQMPNRARCLARED